MKKLFVIMIVMLAIAIAAPAFATTLITSPTGTSIGGAAFVPSTGVRINAGSAATTYVALSAHVSAASGPGYQFQIWNSFNGVTKKQWVNEATSAWPAAITDASTTVTGFQ